MHRAPGWRWVGLAAAGLLAACGTRTELLESRGVGRADPGQTGLDGSGGPSLDASVPPPQVDATAPPPRFDGAIPPPQMCTSDSTWTRPTRVHTSGNRIFADTLGNAYLLVQAISIARFDARSELWGNFVMLGSTSGAFVDFDSRGNGVVGGARGSVAAPLVAWQLAASTRTWGSMDLLPRTVGGHESLCGAAVSGNRAVVLWRRDESGSGIFSSDYWISWTVGGEWRTEQLFDGGGEGDPFCRASVAFASEPIALFGGVNGMFAYHLDPASQSWSAVRVSHAGRFSGNAQLEADANGNSVAVWHEQTNAFEPNHASTVWSNRWDARASAWRGPEQVADAEDGQAVWELRLSVSEQGAAMAVWRESPDFVAQRGHIWAARLDRSSANWQQARELAMDGRFPAVSMAANGNAFVGWDDRGIVTLAQRYEASTGWQMPEVIPELRGTLGLAAAGDGTAFAASGGLVSRYLCDEGTP